MRTLFLLALLPLFSFQQVAPKTYTEEQKIAYVISSLGRLDAVFIRNGAEHKPSEAMEHLRMKRKKAGKQIKTARQFITEVASKSSISGEAYLIKFKDGHTETAEAYLNKQLDRLEKAKR